MKNSVAIVAGGIGSRMNRDMPKQFLLLAGKPMLMHSIQAFFQAFPNILIWVTLPEGQFDAWNNLCRQFQCTVPHALVVGGKTRFHSVKNALDAIPEDGMIAIHDGARPMITPNLIRHLFMTARLKGNAVPVVPVSDSIRQIDGAKNHSVDRNAFVVAQTPQVFSAKSIKHAYAQPYSPYFTDDASVVESSGEQIILVEGDVNNLKITHPHDLIIAEALLTSKRG